MPDPDAAPEAVERETEWVNAAAHAWAAEDPLVLLLESILSHVLHGVPPLTDPGCRRHRGTGRHFWRVWHPNTRRVINDLATAGYTIVPTRAADAAEVERLRNGLERIKEWADAYPLTVFPEPDFKRAAEVLAAAGMTLDAISASNMRHCVEGVGKIARTALGGAA